MLFFIIEKQDKRWIKEAILSVPEPSAFLRKSTSLMSKWPSKQLGLLKRRSLKQIRVDLLLCEGATGTASTLSALCMQLEIC